MGLFSETECRHCGSKDHASEDCPHEKGFLGLGAETECRHCGSKDHASDHCPHDKGFLGLGAETGCRHCGSTSHASDDCPHDKGFVGLGAETECRHCGSKGHASDDCPHEKGFLGLGAETECRSCGSNNHATKDCPHDSAWGAKSSTNGSRDSDEGDFQDSDKDESFSGGGTSSSPKGGGCSTLIFAILFLVVYFNQPATKTQFSKTQNETPSSREMEILKLPYADVGGYDTEGGYSGNNYVLQKDINLFESYSATTCGKFVGKKGEIAKAMGSVVTTTRFGLAKALRECEVVYWNSGNTQTFRIKRDDVIHVLHPSGEGMCKGWFKGKIIDGLDLYTPVVDSKVMRMVQEVSYDTWIQLKFLDGKTGWTREKEKLHIKYATGIDVETKDYSKPAEIQISTSLTPSGKIEPAPAPTAPTFPETNEGSLLGDDVNFRSSPEITKKNKMGIFSKGTKFKILEQTPGDPPWYKVQLLNGRVGWFRGDFVQKERNGGEK